MPVRDLVEVEARHHQSVSNGAIRQPCLKLTRGQQLDRRLFGASVADLRHALRAAREERVHPVAEQCGVRVEGADRQNFGGAVARFLEQLACGGLCRCFPWIDDPARDFQRELTRAMTPLSHHHELVIARERDDIHPLGSIDAEEGINLARARRAEKRATDPKDFAVLKRLGLEFLPRTGQA